ncbi:unnamed protein product [Calicophoron daubneyi]|uniref:Uncharacterized protein n=1 Tax=Calicophoron daubneyi TaxID=300641 RepID=A0AAV2T7P0_CALDB
MTGYGKGTNCDKLWRAWYGILTTIFHVFLVYIGITRYTAFKGQAFDAKFGGNWDQSGMNFALAMLISALALFCLFLITNLIRTSNYANEGIQIGRDTDNLHLLSPNPAWRAAAIPMTCLNTSSIASNCMYGNALNSTGGMIPTLQRSGYPTLAGGGGGSEDDRISAMGGEEPLHNTGAFDTWSARSGVNQELLLPYMGNSQRNVQPEHSVHMSIRQSAVLLWHRFQRHFLPYAIILHLITAYCLLLPIPLMHAQQIYHRALPSEWIFRSDLDILFGSSSPATQPAKQILAAVAISDGETGPGKSASEGPHYSVWDDLRAMSPEFFNLIVAFMLLSLRYPSVFWYTNRAFSFVFSLLLLLTGLHALVEFSAASVLVKMSWNRQRLREGSDWSTKARLLSLPRRPPEENKFPTIDPSTADMSTGPASISNYSDPLIHIGPLALSVVGNLAFLCLFLTVFEYGYRQFTENLAAYRHYLVGSTNPTGIPLTNGDIYQSADAMERRSSGMINGNGGGIYNHATSDSVQSAQNASGKGNFCLGTVNENNPSRFYRTGAEILHPACRCCLHSYAPHLFGLLGILCLLGFKIPVIWDCIQFYRHLRHPLMLAAPLSSIIVICAWFIAWFAFWLKPAWKFQVNLPLQAVAGSQLNPNSAMLSIPPLSNGMYPAPLLGSLMRQSSLAMGSGINGRISTTLLGPHQMGPPGSQTPLLAPPSSCLIPDESGANQMGVPSSPIYACFHDQGNGFYGTTTGQVFPRTIRLGTGVTEFTLNPNSGLVGMDINGQRGLEYCGEDAEASSGRQSGGNNYVCLQSAMNGGTSGSQQQTGLMSADGQAGRAVQRISPSIPPPLPSLSTMPPTNQALFSTLSKSGGQPSELRIPIDSNHANNVLSSPSSGQPGTEEDSSSTNTVQATTSAIRVGLQNGPLYHASHYGVPNRSAFPSPYMGVGANGRIQMISPSQTTDDIQLPSAYMSDASSRGGGGGPIGSRMATLRQVPNSPVSTTAGSNSLGPRVTFKENVDTITNISPNTSDPGSQNTSSNDSGIDNLKTENQAVTANSLAPKPNSVLPPTALNSSGTYDNTFPGTFRSSLIIRSPSQTKTDLGGLNSGGTIQRVDMRGKPVYTTSSGSVMSNSICAGNRTASGFNGNGNGSLQINSNGENGGVAEGATSHNGLLGTHQHLSLPPSRSGEMIGDGSTSLQSSSTEQFPLLLSSCLLSDEAQEPRLCSQV